MYQMLSSDFTNKFVFFKYQNQPPEVFHKKGVPKKVAKFAGKQLCQSISFNIFEDVRTANLLKKRLWHKFFAVNFAKSLRAPFLQNTSRQLLLKYGKHLFSQT